MAIGRINVAIAHILVFGTEGLNDLLGPLEKLTIKNRQFELAKAFRKEPYSCPRSK
jgi:hypothetical protein